MDKIKTIESFVNAINELRMYKENLLNRLKSHVNKNMVFCKDVSSDILSLYANLSKDEYLCFDTESCRDYNNNENERVWCWSLSNTINDIVVYGHTLDDFIELMKRTYDYKEFNFTKKSKYKNINIVMWVHNLGWDIEFLKYWLVDNKYEEYSKILYDDNSVQDEIIEGNSWNIVENNGQVYNATINIEMPDLIFGKKHFKSYVKMKFYDSVKLVKDSLKVIGQNIIKIDDIFNKIGEEFDYEAIRPYDYELTELERCYIYNDVYILKEFIKQYYIKNNLNGFTASGIAFNNMLNFMFPESKKKYDDFTSIYPEIKDKKVVEIIDKSYSGGYTYCNPSVKGKLIEKEGHSIDRNSSYPSAMKYDKMPYGMPKYFKGKYVKDKKYDIALQRVHFDGFKRKNGSNIGFIKIGSSCDFLQDIKSLGLKKNDYVASNFDKQGNLMTYNYTLILTIDELKLLNEAYEFYSFRKVGNKVLKGSKNLIKKLEYVDGCKFLSKIGHLGAFIDDCTKRKIECGRNKNKCGKIVAKTDMNSVYGKLGSSFTRTIMNYTLDSHGLFKHERKYQNENEFDYEEKRKYYRAYASFTTSYGRIALQSIILKIEKMYGSENFLYSDTDSIYATLSVEQFQEMGVYMHHENLGAWDIEKEFTKFKCLGPKKYLLYGFDYYEQTHEDAKIHPHCAGLTVDAQKTLTFENFFLGAVFKKKQKRKVKGGYRLENTTFELKEFSFYG